MYTWVLSCLRGHNLVLFSIGHNEVLHWIQNSLSQQPEIVFSWNKRINWAYSFVKKSRRVFVLFKIIFFRNRSFSNANWFYSKNRKIWKGNLYLTENRFSRNEMWCAVVNHNHMYHICAKGFLDSYFCSAVTDKISFFRKLPQIANTKIVVLKVGL